MILLHHLLAEAVVDPSAIRQAEVELVVVQLVAEWVAVPKILQEALSQRLLATPSRNHLSMISSDTISVFPCPQLCDELTSQYLDHPARYG
jgi:hypothetical protein